MDSHPSPIDVVSEMIWFTLSLSAVDTIANNHLLIRSQYLLRALSGLSRYCDSSWECMGCYGHTAKRSRCGHQGRSPNCSGWEVRGYRGRVSDTEEINLPGTLC